MEFNFQEIVDLLTIEETAKFRDRLDVEYNKKLNKLKDDVSQAQERINKLEQ
jgi:hypothetical protein